MFFFLSHLPIVRSELMMTFLNRVMCIKTHFDNVLYVRVQMTSSLPSLVINLLSSQPKCLLIHYVADIAFVTRLLNNKHQLSTLKMMKLARFCCCSVRTACLVFGILGILCGIFGRSIHITYNTTSIREGLI